MENSNKPDHKHQFSCVYCDIPTTISKSIISWGTQHIEDSALYQDESDPSYGRESNVHCTVFFGIHTESAIPVLHVLKTEEPFFIRLGSISCFQNNRFDVVKIEVSGSDLFRLHQKIGSYLPSTECYHCYCPHITIAYLQKGMGVKYVGDKTFDKVAVRVDNLFFSSKRGGKCKIRLVENKKLCA